MIVDSRPPHPTRFAYGSSANTGDAIRVSGALEPGWDTDWNRGIVAEQITILQPWGATANMVFRYAQARIVIEPGNLLAEYLLRCLQLKMIDGLQSCRKLVDLCPLRSEFHAGSFSVIRR